VIRNIIWDLDGTLFDTYPAMAAAFRLALRDLGGDADLDWLEALARESVGHCISTMADTYGLSEDDVTQGFAEHYAHIEAEEQPPFSGVVEICWYILRIGGQNCIVTHRGSESTARLLAAHGMAGLFTACVTGGGGYPKKPDPAAMQAILSEHALLREETIAVGDRDIDILAGRAAGLFTCRFGAESGAVKADLRVDRFSELYEFLVAATGSTEA